ncbi:MAG: nucleoside 2-deoxyribosyltransferase [Acidobacteria bacterium]|nr:nucleoside 2-deoxyribosyltransferase [Acidobacteriota bacterium]
MDNSSNVISEVSGTAFVFADVSFERPSCYYELGIARALQKPTFIVARTGTIIHQCEGNVHYYVNLIEYEDLVRKALNTAT